jgi:hypothetical protein
MATEPSQNTGKKSKFGGHQQKANKLSDGRAHSEIRYIGIFDIRTTGRKWKIKGKEVSTVRPY